MPLHLDQVDQGYGYVVVGSEAVQDVWLCSACSYTVVDAFSLWTGHHDIAFIVVLISQIDLHPSNV